jgi:cytochrome c
MGDGQIAHPLYARLSEDIRPAVDLGMKNSGITWNAQAFREFVSDPAAKVPGTMMLLSVKDEKEVGDLWAYLKQFGADGKKRSQ